MEEFKVVRKEIGDLTEFSFDGLRVWKFLVKNLSENICYVQAEADDTEAQSIIVPSMSWEIIELNSNDYRTDFYNSLFINGHGLIEVRAVEWERV